MVYKRLIKNVYFLGVIWCIVTLLIAGCTSSQQTSSAIGKQGGSNANQSLAEVKIPDQFTPSMVYEPYIAEELGFFKEEGIKAVFTGVIPPGQHVAAVVAGNNDVGTLHVNRTIGGIQAGAKIKGVVATSESTKEYPHMTYYVLENSPIKTAQDLVGKKVGIIAIGGCNEYTPYEWLRKNGVANPKDKITLVTVPLGSEEQALRSGQVDVIGYHGTAKDLSAHGGVRLLFDDYDVWGTVGGACPWYFSEKFISEKPEVVRGFVKAMARAEDWINANPDKASAMAAKRQGVDPKSITLMHNADHGIIKEDSIQIWLDIMKYYGELKRDLKPADIFTNDFNDYAK